VGFGANHISLFQGWQKGAISFLQNQALATVKMNCLVAIFHAAHELQCGG